MKVFVPNPIHEAAVERLKKEAEVVLWNDPEISSWKENADGIIVRTFEVRAADIAQCKKLRVVGKHGIGVDNIDVQDARKHGIEVIYTPHANVESVAEHAVAFMLALSRNFWTVNKLIRQGQKVTVADVIGCELEGKTLGIIGLGRIGRKVGTILTAAFGMKVLGFDPFLPADAWKTIPFATEKCDDIKQLISGSDYVTIHVPLTDQTRNLIGPAELACFKKTGILVNTSRGGIVDEGALYAALKENKLLAAGFDVFVSEPPTNANPLFSLDNFLGMPHLGANTTDALYRMGMTVVEDMLRLFKNEKAMYYVP